MHCYISGSSPFKSSKHVLSEGKNLSCKILQSSWTRVGAGWGMEPQECLHDFVDDPMTFLPQEFHTFLERASGSGVLFGSTFHINQKSLDPEVPFRNFTYLS